MSERAVILCLMTALAGCKQIFGLHDLDHDAGTPIPDGVASPVASSILEGSGTPFAGTVTGGDLSRDTIEPDVFVPNGLHVVGYRKSGITAMTDLDNLPNLGTPSGEIYGLNPSAAWPNSPGSGQSSFPLGLDLGKEDNFSLVLDGEIYLDAGSTDFVLVADDAAVFEITGSLGPTRFSAGFQSAGEVTIEADAAGWYPIRGAYSDDTGDASLALDIASGDQVVVDPARLRARTTSVPGLEMTVCSPSELETVAGPGYHPAALDDDGEIPLDYPVTQSSIRFEGQLLIDDAGMHAIAVEISAPEGYRLFVDGTLRASQWLTEPPLASTAQALDAGWHAIVVDFASEGDIGRLALRLDGSVVAADHLRPTQPQGRVTAVTPLPCDYSAFSGTVTCPLAVTGGGSGTIIDYVDLAYTVVGSRNLDLGIELGSAAEPVTVPKNTNENEGSPAYTYQSRDLTFAGSASADTWRVTAGGLLGVGSGSLTPTLAITTHGGPGAPFADAIVYESPAFAMPPQAVVSQLVATDKLAGTTATFALRTADDASALAAASYNDVAPGTLLDLPAGALLQYRVTIAGDGWSYPEIDSVEIDYMAPD